MYICLNDNQDLYSTAHTSYNKFLSLFSAFMQITRESSEISIHEHNGEANLVISKRWDEKS